MPEIIVYTSEPCSFCTRAKRLLEKKGVTFREIFIRRDDWEARARIAEITGHYTVPQVIVDGTPIGGWDDLAALERAGRLDEILLAA
ncbi:MAG TPA: glutaredoxin domain-containing protein [Miltoncostaeaceae bacterium]|nr:glutaredoxin domain-containing protein [Miltoncostaeaceae bacterium]